MGLFGFRKKKVYTYKTVDGYGRAESIGTSNNPFRRTQEHSNSRKKYVKLIVTSGPLTRREAGRRETRKLKSYRKATGRLPKYNKTADGKYKRWY